MQYKYKLEIYHVPSKITVEFPAFLDSIEDVYTPSWDSDHTFGRNDPNMSFSGTVRTINVTFDIPAESLEEAIDNQRKLSRLAQFQYAVYTSNENNAASIQGSPLVKVKFANLLHDVSKGNSYFASAEQAGLVCVMGPTSIAPDTNVGFFGNTGGGLLPPTGELYAKHYRLTLSLTVLHTHNMGWKSSGKGMKFRSNGAENYPYAIGDIESAPVIFTAEDIIREVGARPPEEAFEGAISNSPNGDINTVKTARMIEDN